MWFEGMFESECRRLDFDFLLLSPGIPQTHLLAMQPARERSIPVMGEIELGCRVAKNPMIGITGTNGRQQ